MRIVSWNVLHGGGKRSPQIVEQLRIWKPDLVGLCEIRGTPPSRLIVSALREMGLVHQFPDVTSTNSAADRVLLASRWPLHIQQNTEGILSGGRWIQSLVELPAPLLVTLLWVPNRDSGDKELFHQAVLSALGPLANVPAVAFGDTNTGVPGLDEEVSFFNAQEGQWFRDLQEAGWTDLWRHRNPDKREYTWHTHSHRRAGFRLDQMFVTAALLPRVKAIRYEWGVPTGKLRGPSDHAAILADLDL